MATYWENSCSFGLRNVFMVKYLIVSLDFSHLGFWSGSLFLIAPFPDLCLLVLFFPTDWTMIKHTQHCPCLSRLCLNDTKRLNSVNCASSLSKVFYSQC